MTADGTNPVARGHEITTAAELDALPIGSRVGCKDVRTWERRPDLWWQSPQHPYAENSAALFRGHGGCPLTVLFRPDAPQPATTDECTGTHDCAARSHIHGCFVPECTGEAADREALVERVMREQGVEDPDLRTVAVEVVRALAARGDAAPTEVEWGARPDPYPGQVARVDSRAEAETIVRESGYGVVVRRTVSAWREVQP